MTLNPEVERLLRDECYRTKRSFKEALNSAVRATLRPAPRRLPKLLPPRAMGLRARCAGSNLVTDAQIAAIASGGGSVYFCDHDLGSFPRIDWTNPLE